MLFDIVIFYLCTYWHEELHILKLVISVLPSLIILRSEIFGLELGYS